MPRKVFTAGEVLAAADVNEFLMDQTIQVFAGTAARGSAIASPIEGMYSHLNDTDLLEYYDGSAWVGAIPDSGLVLLKTQAVGTAVSSIVVSDVFSATYDQYRIVLSGGTASTNTSFNLKLGAAANGHNTQFIFSTWTSSSGNPTLNGGANAANFTFVGSALTTTLSLSVDAINPFAATPTQLWGLGSQGTATSGLFQGLQTGSTSFTAFTLSTVTGTVTGGTINVYGYRKA
jgi:hypothetical protein